MNKKWLLAFALASFSIASAKTYTITISEPCVVGSTQLSPGDYKLKLEGATAVFTSQNAGKSLVEAKVNVQNVKDKFDETELGIKKVAGVDRIEEIHLAGTRMNVKFD